MKRIISTSKTNRQGERGTAIIAILIFMGLVMVLAIGASKFSISAMRAEEQEETKLREMWQARSAAAVVTANLRVRIPQQYEADLTQARQWAGSRGLPSFDEQGLSPDRSVPVAAVDPETGRLYQVNDPTFATSLLGNADEWGQARSKIAEDAAAAQGYGSHVVKVMSLKEVTRLYAGGTNEPAYKLRYIVDSVIGYYRTRPHGEIVLGANDANCGTSVTLTANPTSVIRGNQTTLTAVYSQANKIRIKNSRGDILTERNVTEQSTPQTFDYVFTPNSTDSYYAEAENSGACSSRSAPVTVTVNEPPCPIINVFQPSSFLVDAGQSVVINWSVSNATQVKLDGNDVATTGSLSVVINADRTFTLEAFGIGGSCPQTRQFTVRVRPPTPCNTPRIDSFNANPTQVIAGQQTTLSWSVSNLDAGATVRITGPNGFSQVVSSSGTLVVTPPNTQGQYVYTITAANPCGNSASQPIVITVITCPSPQIVAFTATPNSVVQGAGGTVRLSWQVNDPSGTGVTVSISPGVGGGLPATGFVDISVPVVTTVYTLTASTGCGESSTSNVTVTVTPPSGCPPPAPGEPRASAYYTARGSVSGPWGVFGSTVEKFTNLYIRVRLFDPNQVRLEVLITTDDRGGVNGTLNYANGTLGGGYTWTINAPSSTTLTVTDGTGTVVGTFPVIKSAGPYLIRWRSVGSFPATPLESFTNSVAGNVSTHTAVSNFGSPPSYTFADITTTNVAPVSYSCGSSGIGPMWDSSCEWAKNYSFNDTLSRQFISYKQGELIRDTEMGWVYGSWIETEQDNEQPTSGYNYSNTMPITNYNVGYTYYNCARGQVGPFGTVPFWWTFTGINSSQYDTRTICSGLYNSGAGTFFSIPGTPNSTIWPEILGNKDADYNNGGGSVGNFEDYGYSTCR